jgi:signal transduction histidine kinase/CheY-like chemotaxis protein
MRGRSILDVVHEDDHDRLRSAFAESLAHPERATRAELVVRHRDGGWRTVEAVGRNLLEDPAVGGVVVNARDATEQRRLEQRFHQGQRLESIGRLAGGVAHDFNNLLTVILGCTESLQRAALEQTPPRAEDVDDVIGAAERARDLTRHLLAFARKQVLAPVALDLNEVLRGSERLLRRVLGEDVELVVALAPDLWCVRCDPGQMEQVVVNLAANARDAMPRTGRLGLETANVRLGADDSGGENAPGEYVRLVVRDTGSGLAPEVKAHLFEPFFTTKPTGRGTGLGLATVHGIVSQSGGFIRVQSEPGAGTAFELFFPRTHEVPAPPVATPRPRTTGGSEAVLVVEDDAHVREVTVRTLRAAGYRVLVASGAADALGVSDAELADVRLLVTDVVMPGLDGRQVAARLHRRREGLRVLYVSGYTQGAIADRDVLEPGSDFLAKPFTATALLAAVRELLDAPPAEARGATAGTGTGGPAPGAR